MAVLASALLASASTVALAGEVTSDRLMNADKEPQNWLMVNKNYSSHRFSGLDQINRDNVKNLHVAFTVALGGAVGVAPMTLGGHQSTPLVDDGWMYVVDGYGAVYKIDVRDPQKAKIAWIMDPGIPKAEVWIPSNRGVTFYKNFVISVTGNGKVLWTNRDTGEMVKTAQVDDPTNGFSLTAAPLVIGDKLIVGGSGGDRGARAHIDALNADTGQLLWRTYTVPAPGEPGSETWKDKNNAWKHGGGSYWQTGSYDPTTNLTIWGTGQPVPMFDPEYRPGDNLFTNSVVALHASSGKLAWYFQFSPHDEHDWDSGQTPILANVLIDGLERKVICWPNRNGFYYVLDRATGEFLVGTPFVEINWTKGLSSPGRPIPVDANTVTKGGRVTKPGVIGGVNWEPSAFNPALGLVFVNATEGQSVFTKSETDRVIRGTEKGFFPGSGGSMLGPITHVVRALDAATGAKRWEYYAPLLKGTGKGGMLATAGGIVFGTSGGSLFALEATTGKELWLVRLGGDTRAPPISFTLEGRQMIAVLAGQAMFLFGL